MSVNNSHAIDGSMTVIIHFNVQPLSLSRGLSRIHYRTRLWPLCINKCAKNSWRQFSTNQRQHSPSEFPKTIRENIYTLPNLLTLSRIFSCPILGWSILDGNYHLATGLLVYAGLTDLVSVICLSFLSFFFSSCFFCLSSSTGL